MALQWAVCLLGQTATHAVFGLPPLAFHVVNVALYVIVTSLIHMFMREMDNASREGALAASLLFAVHPIHSEAVTGLVGRADVLCAAFFLSCLMAYMHLDNNHVDEGIQKFKSYCQDLNVNHNNLPHEQFEF
ncbi:hypothetical protein CAPTEDRAFT_188081 [Capitella teleta]|uniref:Uncharacterized protein n=1 Tax=Capitella teleta TaxID=283909 RepID=R7UEF0_CAPTE|nr:hypothetical protein CAPTEDRAFT_188081 [Capitella teleta]|eukprot:ELU04914.1 hypothetical protein CAPTEDRAFT_188081 [Capitella teleta]